MEQIFDLVKNREPFYVDAGRSVLDTVRYMVARNIGAVAVIADDQLIGIFSERDLMKRVVAPGQDPLQLRVRDVMTADPVVVSPNEKIIDCIRLMRENSFRHLPVCEGKKLRGLISLRDLILHDLTAKEGEVQAMRAYINQAS
ncbi:MAG TPA: CBS domain-containing protein [Terriglobales bacterium]|jgi:CBS domain-containing protein|nr:CBS domain-containing protein [Terriglobales bacterium]